MNWYTILLNIGASYLATAAFAAIFQCPWKLLPLAGIPGAVAWMSYALLKPFIGLGFSMFAAALLLTLTARVLSVRNRCPLTVFLVAGIIPLVPGSGVFLGVFYLLQRELPSALEKGIEAFMTCGAILLGITFISMIPQKVFNLIRKKEKTRQKKVRR